MLDVASDVVANDKNIPKNVPLQKQNPKINLDP